MNLIDLHERLSRSPEYRAAYAAELPLLLDYCPPHLRADLDCNDGFEPRHFDHIADDPERSMIFDAATEARKQGITRAEWISCMIAGAAWNLSDDVGAWIDLIDDPLELAAAIVALRESMADIRRAIARAQRKGGAR